MSGSTWDSLRRQGNAAYTKAVQHGLAPTLRHLNLAKAEGAYRQGLGVSSNLDEKASILKNMGAMNWKHFELHLEESLQDSVDNAGLDLLVASMEYYKEALSAGQAGKKEKEWLSNIDATLLRNLEDTLPILQSLDPVERSSAFFRICKAILSRGVKSQASSTAHLAYADFLFKQCVVLMDVNASNGVRDFKRCKALLDDCHEPLVLAEQSAPPGEDMSILEKVLDLQRSVTLCRMSCESMQATAAGDELLNRILSHDESVNFDAVWDVIDKYKEAILLTRENDLENEAIASSRTGKVYSQVLKMPVIAHRHYLQATQLALPIMSQWIMLSEWYKEASTAVHEYHEKIRKEEEQMTEKQRKPFLAALKVELNLIKQKAKGSSRSFIDFLYKTHPPRVAPTPPGDSDSMKAELKTAILRYHPDKNGKHEEKWKVLCEEIVKHLNVKYQLLKEG